MSSISKAGIFIDVKALFEYTDRMVKEMENADRVTYGDELKRLNLAMIADFTMAYHRRDEHISFTASGKSYDINLKGEKRNLVDKLEADFDAYQALMEFCWENNKSPRIKKRKRRRKHEHFMELMDKIGSGIDKWSKSVYKQVVVSEKDDNAG